LIYGYIMMSRIDSRHWKISTDRHFQNGPHNTAQIQHCPISSKFDMWVDNDVQNWCPTLKFFYQSGTSLCTHISNFNDIGQCWIFIAHFLCCVLAAILKMADTLKILKTQNCSSNGDLSLCNILCLYHYPFRSYQH
jgi:hypothetical protein